MRLYLQQAICIAIAYSVVLGIASAQITIGTLADELADRDQLTQHPGNSFTLEQASSHDTRNGTALGSQLGSPWGFENVDFGNYIRQETNQGRQELVLFEDSGPGAITRWWSTGINGALLNNNNFRIYVNGSNSPVLTQSATGLVGGNNVGFGSSLNFGTPNLGGNFYGPVTYSSGVKVTWDGPTTHGGFANIGEYVANGGTEHNTGNAFWYNINYRKYAPGTDVQSYTGSSTATYASELSNVNSRLSSSTIHGQVDATDTTTGQSLVTGAVYDRNFTAPSGASNGQAIREITLKFNGGSTAEQRDALADTYIELTFDGQMTARVPAGQFFGNGWSENSSNVYNEGTDYFRTVVGDGTLTSRWVMPYQNDAKVRLINAGGNPVNVDLEIKTGAYQWTNDSMHFHSNYRSENDILTRDVGNGNIPSNERYSAEGDADFRFINIRGRGVYVGDTMSIRNRNIGSSTSGDFWWGEGDEKIYVDYLDGNGDGSESTPNQVGTGTEDYYGYSFGSAALFDSPFVTQPIATGQRDATGNGLTVNGRVRGLDTLPFEESLKFDMEVWKWRQGSLDIGAATFWYGRPGAVALNTVADLAADFRAADNPGDAASGISDTTGEGSWSYYSSDNANPSAAGVDLQLMTWGDVGNAGNQGFSGGENGMYNLAAISDEFLFVDGGDNIGIQGSPGYHELSLHPGGDGFQGDAARQYVVAQWTAGDSVDGLINIGGSIRNFIVSGDSVEFYIYVDGVLEFSVNGTGSTLDETPFDFDATISPGQSVDFVLGNGGNESLFGDESLLRAIISADFTVPIDILGDLDGDGLVDANDWVIFRDNYGSTVSDLNDDGIGNAIDFGLFKDAYTSANGANAFQQLVTVPEPSMTVLVCLLGMAVSSCRFCRNPRLI